VRQDQIPILASLPDIRQIPGRFEARIALLTRLGNSKSLSPRKKGQRSSDRALQQMSDPVLQDPVGRQPGRVADALGFEELVDLGLGKRRVAPVVEGA